MIGACGKFAREGTETFNPSFPRNSSPLAPDIVQRNSKCFFSSRFLKQCAGLLLDLNQFAGFNTDIEST